MLQRTLPAGFIAPCLPSKTDKLPSGSGWLHEIKHDGFRVIARKNGAQVRLYSSPPALTLVHYRRGSRRLRRHWRRFVYLAILARNDLACDDTGVASFISPSLRAMTWSSEPAIPYGPHQTRPSWRRTGSRTVGWSSEPAIPYGPHQTRPSWRRTGSRTVGASSGVDAT
jgi:hypothetical protein